MSKGTEEVISAIDSMISEMDRKFMWVKISFVLWFSAMAIFIITTS